MLPLGVTNEPDLNYSLHVSTIFHSLNSKLIHKLYYIYFTLIKGLIIIKDEYLLFKSLHHPDHRLI